jgi:hypothetical protein
MSDDIRRLPPDALLKELSQRFMTPAHDRQVYCVFGPYERLRPFQRRLKAQVETKAFDTPLGRVQYLSVNADIPEYLKAAGTFDRAARLARADRTEEFRALLSQTFRNLITERIESAGVIGLVLADFELLYAYDLGDSDISLARQVAINGKRVCLLVPGAMRDGRLWIFDNDSESRREFPEALVFKSSGWVFELAE